MYEMKPFEKIIEGTLSKNSLMFLRRAADEIAKHDDSADDPFDEETAAFTTILTQTAVELALSAFVVRHYGVKSIVEKAERLTDEDILSQWNDNSLRTKRFDDTKKFAFGKRPGQLSIFEGVIDEFQKSRNKILHLNFRFDESSLYDLKYESTTMLIHVVTNLLYEDEESLPHITSKIFGAETLNKLLSMEAYLNGIYKLAQNFCITVLDCIHCDKKAYADEIGMCFACGATWEGHLMKCDSCDIKSVIYDHLNIDINDTLPSVCLNCRNRSSVFRCKSCGDDYFVVSDSRHCKWCEEDLRA